MSLTRIPPKSWSSGFVDFRVREKGDAKKTTRELSRLKLDL